jgi:hypothetical protein
MFTRQDLSYRDGRSVLNNTTHLTHRQDVLRASVFSDTTESHSLTFIARLPSLSYGKSGVLHKYSACVT